MKLKAVFIYFRPEVKNMLVIVVWHCERLKKTGIKNKNTAAAYIFFCFPSSIFNLIFFSKIKKKNSKNSI